MMINVAEFRLYMESILLLLLLLLDETATRHKRNLDRPPITRQLVTKRSIFEVRRHVAEFIPIESSEKWVHVLDSNSSHIIKI